MMTEQLYAHELPIARAYLRREGHENAFGGFLAAAVNNRSTQVIETFPPATIRTIPAGESLPDNPAFRLDFPSAQHLLDALWEAGLRPSTGEKAIERAELAAVKAHLQDMRALVFGQVETHAGVMIDVEAALERYKDQVAA